MKRVLKPLNYSHSFKYLEMFVLCQFIFKLNAEKRKLVLRFVGQSIIVTLIFYNQVKYFRIFCVLNCQ